MNTATRQYDARVFREGTYRDSSDGICSEWIAKLARDRRFTDPKLRAIGLMIAGTAYWPTKFVRVEDATIVRQLQVDKAQVVLAIQQLIALDYARFNGTSADGRTELRLMVPHIRKSTAKGQTGGRR